MATRRLFLAAMSIAVAVVVATSALFVFRPAEPRREVVLLGAGATFPHPQLDHWIKEFIKRYPWIRIEYSPVGSGAGQRMFLEKTVDFACSDPPLPRKSWEAARRDPRGVVQLPIILGAVVVIYNVPGLEGRLHFDGETLALVYAGEIERWDNPRIRALNPDLELPGEKIYVVHRADASGTTQIFTLFLHKSSGGWWTRDFVGTAIEWVVDRTGRGLGGKGNAGVAELVKKTPYSVGYVEYAFAVIAKLPTALIENAEGESLEATDETVARAAENAYPLLPESADGDFNKAWEAMVYPPGKGAYPIASFSFIILYQVYDPDKLEALTLFLRFIYAEGLRMIVPGYVAVPADLAEYNLKALQMVGSR